MMNVYKIAPVHIGITPTLVVIQYAHLVILAVYTAQVHQRLVLNVNQILIYIMMYVYRIAPLHIGMTPTLAIQSAAYVILVVIIALIQQLLVQTVVEKRVFYMRNNA